MPLNITVKKTDSNQGIEVDVNEVLQVDIEPVRQEIEIEVEHVPCCTFSFACVLKAVGVVVSGAVSILTVVGGFLTGRF